MDNRQKRFTHLKKYCNFNPRTILDLGAYEGTWSLMIKKVFPQSQIFMVESNPTKKSVLDIINIPYKIALLGDMNNVYANYYMTKMEDSSSNSVYRERSRNFTDENIHIARLPMITLNKIVIDNNLKNIDLINFDLRGSEIDVINGAKNILPSVKYISITTQTIEYNIDAPKITEVILTLDKLGFKLYDIIDSIYIKDDAKLKSLELLFVNSIQIIERIWNEDLTTEDYINTINIEIRNL